MGLVWDYFFGSFTAAANVKRVQNDEQSTQHLHPNRTSDSHANDKRTASGKGPKGQRHVKLAEKDADRSINDNKQGKQPQEKGKSDRVASSVIGTADLEVEDGSNTQHSMDENSSQLNRGEKDDQLYRDCGHVRTKRVDLNLPDHIDQSQLEPVHSHVPECFDLKNAYDKCFQHWFANEFLNGAKSLHPCDDLMDKYTSCVKKGLKDQKVNLYPENCLYGSSDPSVRRVNGPRKKPPPGAEVHHG